MTSERKFFLILSKVLKFYQKNLLRKKSNILYVRRVCQWLINLELTFLNTNKKIKTIISFSKYFHFLLKALVVSKEYKLRLRHTIQLENL
ncbi:hypothetical protein BpHYR1_015039 [Brachionus plicatilis]|uniref:Uncharacterized protein n=1 Tax=Brachionus plicatilis TaxID=10195 RepID=A0A3M7QIW2_BRAPC|nr:hypothetical protein BpHYR1_015039 [Brachionus plicatilis]